MWELVTRLVPRGGAFGTWNSENLDEDGCHTGRFARYVGHVGIGVGTDEVHRLKLTVSVQACRSIIQISVMKVRYKLQVANVHGFFFYDH